MCEAEFAGYVDSGIWELEQFLIQERCDQNIRAMFYRQLWHDCHGRFQI